MKITKYTHSCLVVEQDGKVVLFDPGHYSWDDHANLTDKIEKLDVLVITHKHGDHYHLPMVKALCDKFPNMPIITTPDVKEDLETNGIKNVVHTENAEGIEIALAEHEPLPFNAPMPPNLVVHFGDFTHCGDSLHFSETRSVLALPIAAPWESLTEALELAADKKLKKVIPVHDWPWHDAARRQLYGMSKSMLETKGVEFVEIESDQPIEV